MTSRRLFAPAVLVLVAALLVATGLVARPADAQRRLRAQIYLVQAPIPRGLQERALIGFARGRNARRVAETTGQPIPQRAWVGDLVIAFAAPPGDLEFHVLFYDLTDGGRRFVDDMSTYVNDRTQRTYVQRIRLERPKFKPNRHMELVVTVRREEVGRTTFDMIGEEVQRSGTVSFSDDDTRAPPDR
jgi:hypothetical protein